MSSKTGIEWTEATWNPITGCTKVSQGCKHCYAERDWARLQHLPAYAGRAFTDVATHADRLDQPLRWKRPRRIFVNSMSDLFHPDVPDDFIDVVFAVMSIADRHAFQLLTKRADRMRRYMIAPGRLALVRAASLRLHGDVDEVTAVPSWPLPNVWLGVSVEDQASADERIPLLRQTPAAVRWISFEPLLGPVSMARVPRGGAGNIHWAVVGGESGPKARPMHPEWARDLRDQCAAAGVPFLFKQWGEWHPSIWNDGGDVVLGPTDGYRTELCEGLEMVRCGKRAAGRLLDGVLHDAYPAAGVELQRPEAAA